MYVSNVFTKIINKEISSEIVFENDFVLVINDISPKAKIHWLVLSKGNYTDLKHFLNEASFEEQAAYFQCIKDLLNKLPYCNFQFNIGAESGQEIFHLHAHILSTSNFSEI